MAMDPPRNAVKEFRINEKVRSHIRQLRMNHPNADEKKIKSFFKNHNVYAILTMECINEITAYLETKEPDFWNTLDLSILCWLLHALLQTNEAAWDDSSISIQAVDAAVSTAANAFVSSALKSISNPKRATDVLDILRLFELCLRGVLDSKMPEIDEVFSKYIVSLTRAKRKRLIGIGIHNDGSRIWKKCPQFIKIMCEEVAAKRPDIETVGLDEYLEEYYYKEELSDALAIFVRLDKDLAYRVYEDSKILQNCLHYQGGDIGTALLTEIAEIENNFSDMSKMKMLTDPSFVEYMLAMQRLDLFWITDNILSPLESLSGRKVLEFLIDHGVHCRHIPIENPFIVAQQRREIEWRARAANFNWVLAPREHHQSAEERQRRRHPSCTFVLVDDRSEI